MKRLLLLLALAPLTSACFVAAAAGAGFIVSQKVLPGNVHVADLSLDVETVWPSVKETVGFYQEPGSSPVIQESPRRIEARVDGSAVTIEVEALDIDLTTVRVSAEKYGIARDNATAAQVLRGITERLNR